MRVLDQHRIRSGEGVRIDNKKHDCVYQHGRIDDETYMETGRVEEMMR